MTDVYEIVAKRLTEAGLPSHVTAGIIGQVPHESGGDPSAIGDGGKSIGLWQWHKGRGDGLLKYAQEVGGRNTDPAVQTDYLLSELKQDEGLMNALLKTRTATEAGMLFQRRFERPKVIDPERGRTAERAHGWLSAILGVKSAAAAETSSGGSWAPPAEAFKQSGGDAWEPPAAAFGDDESAPGPQGTVPASVRAAVGSAQSARDRLATLQKFYPQATVTPVEGDNFDIDDPKAGRLRYNPAGLDVGDIASLGPEAAQLVGGTIGAALGSPVGPLGAVGGAGLGAAAGNELFAAYNRMIGGAEDTRTLARRGVDVMTNVVMNAGGQAAGEMLGYIPRALFKARFNGGRKGVEQFSQAVADADRWGVPISVGEAADNAWRVFDNMAPKQASRLKEQAAASAAQAMRRLTADVSGGRGLSRTSVGRAVQTGVEEYGRSMRATGHALDQEFFKMVPPDSRVPMTNTVAAIQRVIPDLASMPQTAAADKASAFGQRMLRLAEDITNGQGSLQLGDVRTFRRTIGEMIETGALVEDMPTLKLRDLHGALTNDMRAAADAAGPAAQQAWARAQSYWQRELRQMEEVLQPLVAKRVPSEVAKALEGKMKNAPEYVSGILSSLNQKQRDLIRAATLRKLGYAKAADQSAAGDVWSFDQFLTDWNGLDRQTRNTLFRDREYVHDLDALARTAEKMHSRAAGGAVPNYAIAGGVGAMAAAPLAVSSGGLGGWMIMPLGFALTAAGAQGGQRLMRNRAFVHWLAEATTKSEKGIGAHMGRLAAIGANSDPQTREDIATFLDNLSGAGDQQ